jgi:chromosome segregation ATPase
MALAAKSPAERLKLILELRRRILEKARELEEALPVVEEVVALSKERRRLKGVLEGLKREKEEHEKRLAALESMIQVLKRRREELAQRLYKIEARARGSATPEAGSTSEAGSEEAVSGGAGGAGQGSQRLLT